jgi:hypothetical protein
MAFSEPLCAVSSAQSKLKYHVDQFTNYTPAAGGINGSCGRSATVGLDACQFALEDHLNGKARAVMGAVPLKGGNSGMFGGIYRLVPFEQSLANKACVLVMAADRYGVQSNHKRKMDIVTHVKSVHARTINTMSGELYLVGSVEEFRGSRRKVKRDPRVTQLRNN